MLKLSKRLNIKLLELFWVPLIDFIVDIEKGIDFIGLKREEIKFINKIKIKKL